MIKKIIDRKVLFALLVICSAILVGFIIKLNALPMLYTGILIAVLTLIDLGLFFMMKPSKKEGNKRIKERIGKLISLLLSLAMVVGTVYIAKGQSALNQITGADSQVSRISLFVLNESEYKTIEDLKGKTVGYNDLVDTEKMSAAVDVLQSKADVELVTEADFIKLATKLYDKEVDAVLINEAYVGIIEEAYEYFVGDARIIWDYDIEEVVEDIRKEVNVTKDCFTIYISGIDTRGPVSTVSRSDVNMLVTINPTTGQVLLTSIPRDYYVSVPAFGGAKDKLTHAANKGVSASVETLEQLFDLEINYYARVNFTSLITMVDALGGVDVYSDKTFVPWTNPNIMIYQGMNHMNGEMALAFARERKTYQNGDNHRVQNQQAVLKAMIDKMISPAIITNYSDILDSFSGCFETNMSSKEITSLLRMQLTEMKVWDIQSTQVNGTGSMQTGGYQVPNQVLWYMIPNMQSVEDAKSLIEQVQNNEVISVN